MTRSMALAMAGVSHAELTTLILNFRARVARETTNLINSFKG